MTIFTGFIAFLVLFVIGLAWFFLYYFGNPVIDDPDGMARVTGNCGDTMEIGLKFRGDRVCDTHLPGQKGKCHPTKLPSLMR